MRPALIRLLPLLCLPLLACRAGSVDDDGTRQAFAPLDDGASSHAGLPSEWEAWLGLDPYQAPEPMDWSAYFERYPHMTYAPSLWEAGDGCLFELLYQNGAERPRWFVLVQSDPEDLTPRFHTATMDLGDSERFGEGLTVMGGWRPALVSVVPAGGGSARARVCELPNLSPGKGFPMAVDEACQAELAELAEDGPDVRLMRGYFAALGPALLALPRLFDGVKSHAELGEILMDVVDRPSLWSMVRGLGVELTMQMDVERNAAETIELDGWPALDGVRIPVTVLANGQVALELDVLAVEPVPPVHLTAGIVGLRARHPSDPRQIVELRLIGARRR